MKKKIAIFGSTGSIGKSLIEIIKKDKKNFEVILLTANKNDKLLIKQAKLLNAKNIKITDEKKYKNLIKKKTKIRIFNNFDNLKNIFYKKVDYIMIAISGTNGLKPTFNSIKYTKKIAIANKESIICAWNILKKELKKNKTQFIPVDSEHFSISRAIDDESIMNIDKIFITASGGPFYNLPLSKFNKIKIKDAIKHPNWRMGKKISIDSSTMMNKIFEIIEAKNIFNLNLKSLKILIHRDSYLHAIVKFKDGFTKMIIHDTDMKIPIFNTLFKNKKYYKKINNFDLAKINNLKLEHPNKKKFPLLNLLDNFPDKFSLFETVVVSTNDSLVEMFLLGKIKFKSIHKLFFSIINDKELNKYKLIVPKNIQEVIKLKIFVQKKIKSRYI